MIDKAGTGDTRAGGTAPAGAGPTFVALRSGLVIRHYVIEEVIGAGGFGITYRARHDRLKSKAFALKEFFPREFATRSGTRVVSTPDGQGIFRWGLDRFLKEAEALARCEHPAIVDVVDYFEENGTAYAVLGYVEGQQLGQWLAALGRPPTQAELDRLLAPLLDALEVVHDAKLLHRDIAPDNIMVRRDGTPCLIDFGAAREDVRDRSRKVSAIVKHGYSPPEQYHGLAELQGPWTDIYALAATLYRAVSGAPPMDSSRRGALGDTLKPMAEMTGEPYRDGFMRAIDMGLRLKPDERPQSVPAWRQMLMEAEKNPPAPLPPSPPRPPTPVPQDWSRLVKVAAVAGILAVGGMGGWAIFSRPQAPDQGRSGETPGPLRPDDQQAARAERERRAAAQWEAIKASTDKALVERFVAEHGATAAAEAARRRLAELDAEVARQAAEEKARRDAATEAERARAAADKAKADRDAAAETAAAGAWGSVRNSSDIGAIERFLAAHGSTSFGPRARERLEELRASARRELERERAWRACLDATGEARIAACTPVIDGPDTPGRRAAALHRRGNAERARASYDRAIADLTRSLELAPGAAQVLTDRGIARFLAAGAGAQQAALADFDAAIAADPRHAEALNNRAWVRLQVGRNPEALADANLSIEIAPTNAYAYDTRAHIFEALGRRDDAIRDYERALAIDKDHESSRAALARLRRAGR